MDNPEDAMSDGKLLTPINTSRLVADLGITGQDLHAIGQLNIPSKVFVTSASEIKLNTVIDILHILLPGRTFNIEAVKVPSGVDEEPLGQKAIDGAFNRLLSGIKKVGRPAADRAAWISIENGLFRRGPRHSELAAKVSWESVTIRAEETDLMPEFDPSAEYEDRAIVLIKIPHYAAIMQISPSEEAIMMPKEIVSAVSRQSGGFAQNTVGAMLQEIGIVRDKQNPHLELSAQRLGGPLPRQDQMARVITRAMIALERSKNL